MSAVSICRTEWPRAPDISAARIPVAIHWPVPKSIRDGAQRTAGAALDEVADQLHADRRDHDDEKEGPDARLLLGRQVTVTEVLADQGDALQEALKGSRSALFTDSWEIKLNATNKIWPQIQSLLDKAK